MKILVIIPVYNEADSIEQVIRDVKNCMIEVDCLVINDCSTDATAVILTNSVDVEYINLPVNLGIGGGVQTGYIYAYNHGYDIAVQFDGDGQHDGKYIKELIRPIEKGTADVVIGSRFIEKQGFQSSRGRRIGISFLSTLIKLCTGGKVQIQDVTSGFRAVNKKMIRLFSEEYAQDYPEPEAIVLSAMSGARILEVPVVMHARNSGVSSITPLKSSYYMIKVSIAIILCRITLKTKDLKEVIL